MSAGSAFLTVTIFLPLSQRRAADIARPTYGRWRIDYTLLLTCD
jgi:hypothetical protein